MSTLRILDKSGDTEIEWLLEQEQSITEAAEIFNNLIKKGYMAYAIEQAYQGHKTPKKIVYDFDPNAQEIVMFTGLRGG